MTLKEVAFVLFQHLRGCFIVLALAINGLIVPMVVVLFCLLYKLTMWLSWQRCAVIIYAWGAWCERAWMIGNKKIFSLLPTQVSCHFDAKLENNKPYMLIANHQTWLDIPILQVYLQQRCAPLRFMLKASLLYVPTIGPACWALGMPLLKRYSLGQLKKKPSRRHINQNRVARACDWLQHQPQVFVTFVEGTRYRLEKKAEYQHVLRPQSSGFAVVAYHWRDHCRQVLDCTLYYQHRRPSFWQFCLGNIPKIVLQVHVIAAPSVRQPYYTDPQTKKSIQTWLTQRWGQKDQWLAKRHQGDESHA
jgi:1-acyl-sn-glycerol-3-phosphate acyltransferase